MVRRGGARRKAHCDSTSDARDGQYRAQRDINAALHLKSNKATPHIETYAHTQPHIVRCPTGQNLERERPTAEVSWNADDFVDGAKGADPVVQVRIVLSVTKETIGLSDAARNLSLETTVTKRDGSATFSDLNFEVAYYAHLFAISKGNIISNAGEWSDPVRFLCPNGGYCLGDDIILGQQYGVPYSKVRPQDGESRVGRGAIAIARA